MMRGRVFSWVLLREKSRCNQLGHLPSFKIDDIAKCYIICLFICFFPPRIKFRCFHLDHLDLFASIVLVCFSHLSNSVAWHNATFGIDHCHGISIKSPMGRSQITTQGKNVPARLERSNNASAMGTDPDQLISYFNFLVGHLTFGYICYGCYGYGMVIWVCAK